MQQFNSDVILLLGPVPVPPESTSWQRRRWLADWMEQDVELPDHARETFSREFIRHETFNELGLTHTCCSLAHDMTPPYFRKLCETEIRETREVEHLQLDELEELVEEFETAFEQLGLPLPEFTACYWKPRMENVLDRSRPVTEEDIRRIEELGVVLKV